jgi:hypothetical protein
MTSQPISRALRLEVHYMRQPTELELAPPPDRRILVKAAWDLARRIDPDADGIHYAHLADRLLECGFALSEFDLARTLYDALNHAHDLFGRVPGARGVWQWTTPGSRNHRAGISGTGLANECYVIAKERDPERSILSYARDILPALLERGAAIRGVDMGATSMRRSVVIRDSSASAASAACIGGSENGGASNHPAVDDMAAGGHDVAYGLI